MRNRVLIAAAVLGVAACESSPTTLPTPAPAATAEIARPGAANAVSPANLIAHWNFDQGSGTTLTDAGGLGYHGTFSGTPTWATGRIGGALAFDGTDYVTIPNMTQASGVARLTLAGWIKRSAPGAKIMLGKQLSNGTQTIGFEVWSDGLVYLDLGTSSYAAGRFPLNDTNWHHVAMVFDGTLSGNANRLKGYLDGVQQTLSWDGTIPSATTTNTTTFRIGRIDNSYSSGLIDDVYMFARVLTPLEIQGLAQVASDSVPPSVPTNLAATPVSSSQINLTWTASTDNVGVTGYRVYRNGVDQGTTGGTSFSSTGLTQNTTYSYAVSAFDAATNASAQTAPVSATTLVPDTTKPIATLTSPVGGATVTGAVSVDASASDSVGVVGVQFKLDGANLGAEDTSAPYSVAWNTTTGIDGSHTLSAVARDAAGNLGNAANVSVTVSNAGNPGGSALFPLSIAPDRRHLLDKNGNAFFVNGDTPWELIQNLTTANADLYLTDRKNKGFNAVLINLIEHEFSPSPPRDIYGNAPFTTPGDFSTPNEAYFAHVDAVLQLALQKDIAVFLVPIYLGFGGGSQGWYAEVNANGATKLRQFGQYVGNRYRNYPNIVWVMGGDYGPNAALSETEAFVQGIKETFGTGAVFTAHNARFQSGVTMYPASDTWLTLNTTYADCNTTPQYLSADYNRVWQGGSVPFFFIEGDYEPGTSGGSCYRSQAYWPVLMGGVGHFYGNEPLWNLNMGSNWQQYLNTPVSQSMIHWKNLFASRPTGLLVPDVGHTVLTSGYGSLNGGFAAAARTSDGRSVIVYAPSPRGLTIDMTKLSGTSAKAWWYNLDSGVATQIGTYPTTGSRTFNPPGSIDIVLVIDDVAAGFGAPGSGTAPPPDVTPPSVPTSLSATAVSSSQINLGWTGSTDNVGVTGYRVYRNGVSQGTTASTTYSSTGLSAGTSYSFTVAAYDAANNTSAQSTAASATTLPPPDVTAPSVPANLSATAVSTSQINLSWSASTDNVGVTGYHVFRNGVDQGTTAGTTYSSTGLAPSTTYTFRVSAYDAASNASAQSTAASATTLTPADVTPPSVPTNVSATAISTSQIDLGWTASTDNVGVTGYHVYRNGVDQGTTAGTTYSSTGLTAGTTYSFTVSAYDAATNASAQSTAASATTLPPPDATPPSVPTDLSAMPTSTSRIDLSWTASTDNVGVTGYHVYRDGVDQGTTPSTTYSSTGLTAGTTYSFTVSAYDAANNTSAQGTAASATTLTPPTDVTAPSVPTGLAATAVSGSQINLGWTASTDNVGVTGYRVYRNGVDQGTTASTTYSSTGLTAGTTYSFTVSAYDAANNTSAQSTAASAATLPPPDATPPSVPTNLSATAISSSQINLGWSASTDNVAVTGYRVFRNGTQVGTSATTSYADPGLTPSTPYSYTVLAYDAANNASAQSTAASATTQAASTGLVASYNFNEGSGTVLVDGSGNGRNGTIQGTPTWTTGKNGQSINYDGTNDNVALGNLTPMNGVGAVTISAWMKRAAAGNHVELGKQNTNHDIAIEMWSDGRVYFQVSNGSESYGTITLNDTSWHYVALVFDGTKTGNANRLKAYVDGLPVTLTFSGTIPSTTTTNTTPFNLGMIGGSYSKGLIDEVRLYSRALTQAQVQADMTTQP